MVPLAQNRAALGADHRNPAWDDAVLSSNTTGKIVFCLPIQRMKHKWLRAKTEWRDSLFYSQTVRTAASYLYILRARLSALRPGNEVAALSQECAAARLAWPGPLTLHLEQRLRRSAARVGSIDWDRWLPQWKTDRIEKAVILKPYVNPAEKGVILIAFEYQWARLLSLKNLDEFARHYTLVLVPSASPPYGPVLSLFPGRYPGTIFSLLSNESDREVIKAQSDEVHFIPLYASSWVDPERFHPDPTVPRDIDIIMVANFAPVKRHFALFRAMAEVPRHLRIVLVGQPDRSYTVADLRNLAAAYDVVDRVEIMDAVTHIQIAALLRRSKVSIVLSRREGACMVVTESLFSDTPMGILEDAVMGSRTFINSETGRFLRHDHLGSQLADFVANAEQYRPREWALRNQISCYGSTVILNRALKEHALSSGDEWTTDIVPHAWQFDPVLVSSDFERLKSSYADLERRFGIRLGLQFQG
jgi:glycosyltransferase involved in cell wall biosynthesis